VNRRREVPPTPATFEELLDWHHRSHGCGITVSTPVKEYVNPVEKIACEETRRRKYEWTYSFMVCFTNGSFSRHDIRVPPGTSRAMATRLMLHAWSEPVSFLHDYRLRFIDKSGREIPS
jgi:hypothetical protein